MTEKPRHPGIRASYLALALAAIATGYLLHKHREKETATQGNPAQNTPSLPPIPKIDVHVHVSPNQWRIANDLFATNGIARAINASGGIPTQGAETSAQIARESGRILFYCNFPFSFVESPDFAAASVQLLERCKEVGAIGLKVPKSLGLGIVLSDHSLLKVDDPRLDIVFETAGRLRFPVLIHSGDPIAFFRPPTADNERYDELQAHPEWSFYGDRILQDGTRLQWPPWEEVFGQFERRVARHPNTKFIGAHFGNAPELPDRVERLLERYPNFYVETGARIPEIGRHDSERMRALFERFQDRVLFGTDIAVGSDGLTLGSRGIEPDAVERVPAFYAAHWRYFETRDRNFDHPTPIQGRWKINGIALSRVALEKLYWKNAAALFGITL